MASSPSAHRPQPPSVGLRERKKLLTRQLISDTATEMFLQHGFDEIRIADIAEACNVSAKTIHNYFPSKEALLLDEEDQLRETVRAVASDRDTAPVQAMLVMLETRTRGLARALTAPSGPAAVIRAQQFFALIERTPSLRAHHRDNLDRLVDVAAESLARRADLPAHSPEIQATAYALISLWRVHFQSLNRHTAQAQTPEHVVQLVLADLDRAAQLIDGGLRPFWQAQITSYAASGG